MIKMMNPEVRQYLSKIGKKGGSKSRRVLEPAVAREMVRIREARRAYDKFHSRCFWSFDRSYKIKKDDIEWVAENLMKYGGRAGWDLGARLCR